MNVEAERSRSLWMEVPAPRFSPLDHDSEAEVLVVGAGVAGLCTAYELQRRGHRVTVVDRGRFGRGMTARTTAHLAFAIDDGFAALIKAFDADHARAWYESQSHAVDLIGGIVAQLGLDCDFARLDGVLTAAEAKDVETLREELEAAHRAGFTDAAWLDPGAAPLVEYGAIRFPRQARIHPLKFLNGVVRALEQHGAPLYDETAITGLEDVEDGVRATTEAGHTIHARHVVVTTNTPFHLKIPIHTKQAPYRTYAIAAPVPKGSVADALVWDTVEPGYHYVRLQPEAERDMLIVGGEDHKSGTEDEGEDHLERLTAWARARFPQMGEVAYAWSGQVYEPDDYVGFIGKSPEHERVWLATGDSGQGMTTGAAAALILADLIEGRDCPWAALYEPSRQMHRSLGEYVKENVEAAKHWLELVGPGEVRGAAKIGRGEGAIMKVAGKPVAVFRDEAGELHARSAACTHAGCTVHWNGFEGCWDCPCHGSQFGTDGQVLNGPAVTPLAAVELDEADRRPGADAPGVVRPGLS